MYKGTKISNKRRVPFVGGQKARYSLPYTGPNSRTVGGVIGNSLIIMASTYLFLDIATHSIVTLWKNERASILNELHETEDLYKLHLQSKDVTIEQLKKENLLLKEHHKE